MPDLVSVIFGLFVMLFGVSVINHSIVDSLNRWMKSTGTNQRPGEIEMSEMSVVVGRAMGLGGSCLVQV
jgi:hypothetical protein